MISTLILSLIIAADPPKCDTLGLSVEQIEVAVEQALVEFSEAGLLEEDTWPLALRVGEILGCSVEEYVSIIFEDGFDSGDTSHWVNAVNVLEAKVASPQGASFSSFEVYDPRVAYCSTGNSVTHPDVGRLRVSDRLNRMCHRHDKCYERDCIKSSMCFFRGQNTQSHPCDTVFYNYCNSNLPLAFEDIIVCSVAKRIRFHVPTDAECFQPPCKGGNTCVWSEAGGTCGTASGCIKCSGILGSCTIPYDPLSYGCQPLFSGPCTSNSTDPFHQSFIESCDEICNMCNMCSQGPLCQSYEGSATRSGFNGPLLAAASATCSGITGFSITDTVADHVTFVGVRNQFLAGNYSTYDTCNNFNGCFSTVGSGTASLGSDSISAQFTFLGSSYTVAVTCRQP